MVLKQKSYYTVDPLLHLRLCQLSKKMLKIAQNCCTTQYLKVLICSNKYVKDKYNYVCMEV